MVGYTVFLDLRALTSVRIVSNAVCCLRSILNGLLCMGTLAAARYLLERGEARRLLLLLRIAMLKTTKRGWPASRSTWSLIP